ncbi:unnamed protein product [Caenorhabditis brenneri]
MRYFADDHNGGGGGRPGSGRPGNGNGNGGNNRGCPSSWTRLNRANGAWCVRVYAGTLSQTDAEARCNSQSATLSGIQSQAEAETIGKLALSAISQSSGSIRIGLVRRPACATSPISTTCSSLNSFHWTDKATTGTNGLLWNNNQPDNQHGNTQQCAVLLASRTAQVKDNWVWEANRLDDVGCGVVAGENQARTIRAYVCGRRASN